ncbi:MAG: DEAD/DEAH box helicase [Deltaproteobacteria bacterium]|nr:DEAD/DEAH box helicase [Deltaproteobacteria bacterium]
MINKKKFEELGISANVLKAIDKKGFEEPTAIQIMTIPVMMQGDTNIVSQAQTGTGKTAAFGLPLIEIINPKSKAVQALILAPTRELAIQVSEEISSLKGDCGIKIAPIYGGQSINQQLQRLKKGVHIVVGTPGRVIDHLKRKTLKLGDIKHLIIDEADEMLNMGFIEDVEKIMKHTNSDKRTLLFSATMPKKIKDIAHKYMGDYQLIKVKQEPLTTNLTEQIYFEVKASDKFEALCRIIDIKDDFYGLVFCRTKNDVDSVINRLTNRGYDAAAIHGDFSQAQRERTLESFKKKRINILVATDVAARGIDVINLTHVINYSLPENPEAYVHRIGRTGRAGNEGTAITFITPSEYSRLMFIQRIAKTDIKKSKAPEIKEIIKAKKRKIYEDLTAILDNEIDIQYHNWANKLLEENNPPDILAAILNYCFEAQLDPKAYGEIEEIRKRGKQLDQQGKARLFVALGKKDKMTPKKLVDLIMSKVSIQNRQINNIHIADKFSFLTVPFEKAEKIVNSFKGRGQRQLVSHAQQKR